MLLSELFRNYLYFVEGRLVDVECLISGVDRDVFRGERVIFTGLTAPIANTFMFINVSLFIVVFSLLLPRAKRAALTILYDYTSQLLPITNPSFANLIIIIPICFINIVVALCPLLTSCLLLPWALRLLSPL